MKKWYKVEVIDDGKIIASENFYCTQKWLDNFILKTFSAFPQVKRIHAKELRQVR